MPPEVRRAFVLVSLGVVIAAVVWASQMKSLPPADFSFQNGTDPKTIDPARATGDTESRIIFALFEGLLRMLPAGEVDPATGQQPMTPQPAMAESFELSDDGKTYTFHLRKDAKWTDGSEVTSHDFAWSWLRALHPETACEYAQLFYEVPYAQQYNEMIVNIGDRVEVELFNRPGESRDSEANVQQFPRGTIRYGTLRSIRKPPAPKFPVGADEKATETIELQWQDQWVYVVDVAKVNADGTVDWDGETEQQSFAIDPASSVGDQTIQRTHRVLVAFDKLGGLETPDDHTLIVHLNNPVPYFANLIAFYPMYPVNRKCVETHGSPMWTKPENIVTNGPYTLKLRRLRDRVRFEKFRDYYNADQVALETIDAVSVESQNTALNMYERGQLQWVYDPPTAVLEELLKRPDFHPAPKLSVYFYKLNTARPPLDDVRVRRALAMAVDRQQIINEVTKAGQMPAYTLVPPLAGYTSAVGLKPDVAEARQLLADAGYPGGRGFPKLMLSYNTSETHRPIAEVIQQQWQNNLNVKIELQNMEWGSFQEFVQQEKYDLARYGWIADYPDPNTFLDLWITDGAQNNTNWSNPAYDQLIQDASGELDPVKRLSLLRQAEQIWVDEMPVIPIYFYKSLNLIKPNVAGFAPNAQEVHPLHLIRYRDQSPGR
jgi:oligopeptide transport system substrate-binding protein